jgi:hypothetical protein
MVPEPLWNTNLRYLLTNKKWQEIRKQELKRIRCSEEDRKAHGKLHRCEICSQPKDSLDCHEIWHYNDEDKIQTLNGLIMLCKQCHLIKHIGFSSGLAMEGKCNFHGLIRHFCMVNKMTGEDFYEHFKEEYAKWEERSKHKEWQQNLKYIIEYHIELF